MLPSRFRRIPRSVVTFSRVKLPQRPYSVAPSAVGFNDYDQEKKNFKLHVPDRFNFSRDVIGKWARFENETKTTPAFWWIDDNKRELKWNFAEMHEHSKRYTRYDRVANVMAGVCGVRPGDRVMVILPRVPQWWLINLAALRTGSVLIPGTTLLTEGDIRKRVTTSGTSCIFTDPQTAEKVDAIFRDCPSITSKVMVTEDTYYKRSGWLNFTEQYNLVNADHDCVDTLAKDPMTIFFTSGTTGEPKMTEHSHASYGVASVITGKYWLDLAPDDIHWNLSDTGWAKSAWSNLFAPWTQGSCVFIHHTPVFDPQRVLQMMSEYPVTTFCGAPTVYRMMIQQGQSKYNITALRHAVSAGEPLNPEVTDRWIDIAGQPVREGFGQTETVLQCGSFRCIPNKPGSMGKPAPGMDLTIIDENCEEVAPGVEGDLAIRVSPERPVGLFTRYVDEPERTAACFRGDYYLTGDRGQKDEDGYFWFVGRADDVIISAGYRISPFEVESALLEHPAVAESAAVSSPDPIRGEVVKAFIVLTTNYKNADKETLVSELQDHSKRVTAPYKYPRKIEFVDFLPKTVSLKTRRVELRNKEWGKK